MLNVLSLSQLASMYPCMHVDVYNTASKNAAAIHCCMLCCWPIQSTSSKGYIRTFNACQYADGIKPRYEDQ
jgi:hypothetical protein